MSHPDDEYLTLAQVAQVLGVSTDTVLRRVRDRWRQFPGAVEIGPRDKRISKALLLKWVQDQQRRALSPEGDEA